ncbi:MAG TPA: hypothetical protein VM143_16565 [Acidimicrobiales bacterium]|nr:hypothetical protein [Acidimicrobiales bacterium]
MPGLDEAGHGELAVATYNAAWELVDSPDRTSTQDDEALTLAFASRWHWGLAGGGDEQLAIGDWFIGHVAAHLGLAALAVRFSGRALDRVESVGIGGWLLASVYEGMARAHACARDPEGRERYTALAESALTDVDDPEEREVIEDQLRSIP